MYDECYRLRADVVGLLIDLHYTSDTYGYDFIEYVAKWMEENEFELRKYGVDERDVPERERLTGSLDLTNLIIPPAKKMDRCPEDILKEEIENEDK